MFLAVSGQRTLSSTTATEKEQELVSSSGKAIGRTGKHQGPAAGNAQHKATPQTPTQRPTQVNTGNSLVDLERSTGIRCPSSGGAGWITFREKCTTPLLQLYHVLRASFCSPWCISMSGLPAAAHSAFLLLQLESCLSLFIPVFISRRTQLSSTFLWTLFLLLLLFKLRPWLRQKNYLPPLDSSYFHLMKEVSAVLQGRK